MGVEGLLVPLKEALTCTGPVTPADTADAASCMRLSSLNDGSPLPRTLYQCVSMLQ
jgi:hypothetical protein